ncbi:hypothetical protein C8R44DRAFT_992599 [Mycena epipterygia]|nr:hypothetical protein C8R44DRAFT_992599 [Mycena epipterygia]
MQRGPWPALVGLVCHYCFKGMHVNVKVFKCSRCHRISYCDIECQNSDWESHKVMCKALSSLEKNPFAARKLVSLLPKEPTTNVQELRKLAGQQVVVYCDYLPGQTEMKHSWLEREPRCIVCTRTDMVIRMEAALKGTTVDDMMHLIPCPECKLSFCCSRAHWEIADRLHYGPCNDLRDSPSQCYMNKLACGQSMIAASFLDASGHLVWFPDRVKPKWVSLEGQSWEGEFDVEIRKFSRIPQSTPSTFIMAAISDTLTMPMTILYALSKLRDGDGWTRKQTLMVHIVGAGSREFSCSRVFEEILHRTPQVKTLKIIMCGPEAPDHNSLDVEICRDCIKRGRSYVLKFIPEAYHDFVRKQGSDFEHPDLCIGFNSGANHSAVLGYTWPATFKLLVERKIPSLITAYGREDAEKDAALLCAAGAALYPALGPILNPWGSMKAVPSPHSTYGFLVNSGWLAGGFK